MIVCVRDHRDSITLVIVKLIPHAMPMALGFLNNRFP